jgi:membrane-associated progesterone receptor component
MSKEGAFVEIDGQKIPLGDEYKVGPLALMDLVQMAQEKLFELYQEQLKYANDFGLKLKVGDTSAIIIVIGSTFVALWLAYAILASLFPSSEREKLKGPEPEPEPIVLRDFTIQQLREFDGNNEKPIYVALRGEVYDVSSAHELYGPGQGYHLFAGRDSSRAMAKLSFEETDLANPDISKLNPFEKDALDDWVQKFKYYKQYPVVGRISYPPTGQSYTLSELAAHTGIAPAPHDRVHSPILVALNGSVYDVSYGGVEFYGTEGPYAKFAGKDISRALAKMSFSPEDLNSTDLSDATEAQLKTLADWEKKLRDTRKYPIVGSLEQP